MKYLKTKNISQFSISDRTMIVYPDGVGPGNRVVFNSKGGLMLPKGTEAQKPQLSLVRQPIDANGTIRYNTTFSRIEAYVGDAWVTVASAFGTAIVKEQLGPGDGAATIFGPLNTTYAASYAASADNVIVLVENVMQISATNYNIVQNPTSSNTGAETNATALTAANNGTGYVITAIGSTDFTLIGAAANTVGTVFVKTGGTGSGTGKVREVGYYLSFTSAVPDTGGGGNPVFITVYYGYAA